MILHQKALSLCVTTAGIRIPIVQFLKDCGVLVGVKVDSGTATIAGNLLVGNTTELNDRLKLAMEESHGMKLRKIKLNKKPQRAALNHH